VNPGKRLLLESLRRVSLTPRLGRFLETFAAFVLVSRRGSHDMRTNGELRLIGLVLGRCSRPDVSDFIVFDVGANVGDWAAALLEQAAGQAEVHCFEPTPSTFVTLEERHGHHSRVRLNRCALSDSSGTAQLRDYGGCSGLNSLVRDAFHDGHAELHSISTMSGDAYCSDSGIDWIDLLKIDVEGFEWEVLAGFNRMLRQRQIGVIQFEYGYINAAVRRLMRDFFELFENFGYVVGPVRPRGPEFRPFQMLDDNFESGANYVAALPEIAEKLVREAVEPNGE
jgi:FkbM family methyltransferase